MANPRSKRGVINALVCVRGNVKRQYVYLDNLKKFLQSCENPKIFQIVFNDKRNAERLSFDGQSFLNVKTKESWVHSNV